MSEDLIVYDGNDVAVKREPAIVLEEAKRAAKALKDVVSQKNKPVILNGEQYLEFEDLQTLGRFYGVTAKVISSEFIDLGGAQGFFARAVSLRADGSEISAAEAMCMNDETNWKSKPLFQLRSMAQTRACAKALRNVLAWVVVLAGYKPTPAEEMTGNEHKPPVQHPQEKKEQAKEPQKPLTPRVITEPQRKRFYAIAKGTGAHDDHIKEWVFREYGFESTKDITEDVYDEMCQRVKDDLSVKEPGSEG